MQAPDGIKLIFDNQGEGFCFADEARYTEVGELPITIRYSANDLMFRAAITVVLECCETPAQVTVRTMDGSRSDTKALGGTPGYESVGVFRLYKPTGILSRRNKRVNPRAGFQAQANSKDNGRY